MSDPTNWTRDELLHAFRVRDEQLTAARSEARSAEDAARRLRGELDEARAAVLEEVSAKTRARALLASAERRLAEARVWSRAWKWAAKRRERIWRRADNKTCLCENGKVRMGDGKGWRWGDCPFCRTERRLAEALEVLHWFLPLLESEHAEFRDREFGTWLLRARSLLSSPPPPPSGTSYLDDGSGWCVGEEPSGD